MKLPQGKISETLSGGIDEFKSSLDKFKADGIEFVPQEYWPAKACAVYSIGRKMAKKGLFANPATLVPLYLRRPEAIEKR